MEKSAKQKMLDGELYHAGDPEIQEDQALARAWMVRYNATYNETDAKRHALLSARLKSVGANTVVRPPFHCDYGYNIALGPNVFLNYNCVILDVVAVAIGAGTQIGPGVQIYTADHPRDPIVRKTGAEFAGRSPSARMSGLAAVRSFCPASPSTTMQSSAPGASSHGTLRRAPRYAATLPADRPLTARGIPPSGHPTWGFSYSNTGR